MSVGWKWCVIMSIFIMRVVRVSVMCVCLVREGGGERRDREIVGDTIKDQFDCFEIRNCENSSGYWKILHTWPLGSHVFRRRLIKVMSVPTGRCMYSIPL